MHGRGTCVTEGVRGWGGQGGGGWLGGMHGAGEGACVAGGHVWWRQPGGGAWQKLRDTVNERAVRILLECILVMFNFYRPAGEGNGPLVFPTDWLLSQSAYICL